MLLAILVMSKLLSVRQRVWMTTNIFVAAV
jgi:hypothetical protein